MKLKIAAVSVCIAIPLASVPAQADSLYAPGAFSALASDRTARAVGDILNIVVYQNTMAANSATTGSRKNTRIGGSVSAGDTGSASFDKSAGLSLGGSSDNEGSSGRSDRMIAQLGATVDEVLPNGDMRVTGAQVLNINGEHTLVRIRGRVRSADISPGNTVISSRLSNVTIDYNGKGFVSRSGKPGIVSRIFNFLGIL